MKKGNTDRLAKLGLLTSLALIAGYIELLIPVPIGIPGVKLGLANLMIVWALYEMGPAEALAVNGIRILLAGFLFGNLSMILYSLAGAALSFVCMWLAKKSGRFSVAGVSILGESCTMSVSFSSPCSCWRQGAWSITDRSCWRRGLLRGC